MDRYDEEGYLFTAGDIKNLADNKIVVPILSTSLLRHENGHKLDAFVPVLGELKGLEEMYYDEFEIDNDLMFSAIELLADLPVRFLSTYDFPLEAGKIEDVVRVMSKMKHLESIDIEGYHWSCYKLSFEEFKLFRHLPVKTLDVDALWPEVLRDHLVDFGKVIMEMKMPAIRSNDHKIDIWDPLIVKEILAGWG